LFHDYEKKFNKGYKELLAGNCYQFNLTEKFEFSINTTDPLSIMGSLWKTPNARAPYGHASFIPSINKFYLSNSPESLFELSKKGQQFCIRTRPIKGTIANENNSNQNWKRLLKSEKDRAELYMITDLMRNDLSRIQKPNARVIKKRSRLFVPGLIHQYSLIEAFLDSTINLFEIIKSLFPGGSITGAPKKRVLEILQKLEKRDRGFYCGSTILLYKKIMASSINIRSAEINLKNNKLYYSSGGGITLLSTAEQEYQETLRKLESFTKLFV
jgi:para-aminobenzoate synthetase component 1